MAAHFQDAIVLFGDSLTQAWYTGSLAHLMSEVYMRKMDVLNRGFGGYTTEWCLPVFSKIFARKESQAGLPPVKLVTIWFGANDASLPPCAQALSLDKYVANLNHYIFSLVEPASEYYQPEARIVLITPPPLVQAMRLEQPLPPHIPKGEQGKERNLEYTRKFKDACLEVGKAWDAKTGGKVKVLDAWTTIVDAAGGEQDDLLRPLYQDGLHFTAQGYRAIFDGLMKLIMSSWEDLNPITMKQTIPRYVAGAKEWVWQTTPPLLAGKAWAEIDPKNPTAALKDKAAVHLKDEL